MYTYFKKCQTVPETFMTTYTTLLAHPNPSPFHTIPRPPGSLPRRQPMLPVSCISFQKYSLHIQSQTHFYIKFSQYSESCFFHLTIHLGNAFSISRYSAASFFLMVEQYFIVWNTIDLTLLSFRVSSTICCFKQHDQKYP